MVTGRSRALAVLLLAAIVLGLAVVGARKNRIDADLVALLPRHAPAAEAMARYAAVFGRDELLVVLVEGADPEQVAATADALADGLRRSPDVRAVHDRVGPGAIDYMRAHRLVLLDQGEWAELERRAGDPRTARRLRAALNSPAAGLASGRLYEDPLDIAGLLGKRLARGARVDVQSGRFATADGRAALVLVEPAHPASDHAADQRLLNSLHDLFNKLPDLLNKSIRVGTTGAPAYALVTERAVRRDLLLSSLASFTAILVLFGLFFRSLRILPLVGLALGAAYLVTLGLWGAVVGRIGAVALGFGGILLGIGVDVPIQLWSRVREELVDHPPAEALSRAVRALTGASIVATLGPALVFGACAPSRFRGLAELGGLAALGLVVNVAIMLLVLPALLAVTTRLWGGVPRATRGEGALERLAAACARRRHAVLVAAAIVVAACGVLAHVRFAPHPLAFDTSLEPARVEDRVDALFGRRRGRVIAFVERTELEPALEADDRATAALRAVDPDGVQSIADLLPSRATQQRRLERIRRSAPTIERSLRKTLDDAGLRPEAFAPFFEALSSPAPATAEELLSSDLGFVASAQLRRTDRGWAAAVYALPTAPEQVPRLRAAAMAAGAAATGVPVVEDEITATLPHDLARISAVSVVAIALLLLLYYRRLRPAAYIFLPLTAAWVVFLALAPTLSVWNVLAVPLVIGYGIDDHVFLVGRALERDTAHAMRYAGRAVALTSLATLAGFASLLLARFDGIRSLGRAGALAVAVCFAAAMIVLPALLGVSRQTRDADHSRQS